MPWSYRTGPGAGIVEIAFTGCTTAADLREATSELIALEKTRGAQRFLVDTTDMELAATLADVLHLPATQYQEEGADRLGRVAVLPPLSPTAQRAVEFYELACENRGWSVRTFPERAAAVRWLTHGTSGSAV